jgi:hypothetical protein
MQTKICSAVVLTALLTAPAIAPAGEIHDAARDGDLSAVRALVGGDPGLIEAADDAGRGPLHWSCAGGHTELVGYLVGRGADVNRRDSRGDTPLLLALYGFHTDAALVLVDNGADVNAANAVGMTPFVLAAGWRDPELVRRMAHEADPAAKDPFGVTALQYTVARGIDDVSKALVDRGADIDATLPNGKSVMQIAKDYGRIEMLEWLSQHGGARPRSEPGGLEGDYLGMAPPGMKPEVFAPGALLMPYQPHGALAFSPDGNELYFAHLAVPINAMWTMKRSEGRWTGPAIASFSRPTEEGDFDGDPCVTYDGERIYFRSARRAEGQNDGERDDTDIWFCERTDSGWGERRNLGTPINTERSERSPSVTRDGTLYFVAEDYDTGLGQSDLYRSRLVGGRYAEPENLGPAVNSEHHDLSCWIAPDDSYIVFASTRPGGHGGMIGLFVSFHNPDDSWTEAVSLGEEINRNNSWHPFVTADGRYLFYMGRGVGRDQYYWVDARIIERYRAE